LILDDLNGKSFTNVQAFTDLNMVAIEIEDISNLSKTNPNIPQKLMYDLALRLGLLLRSPISQNNDEPQKNNIIRYKKSISQKNDSIVQENKLIKNFNLNEEVLIKEIYCNYKKPPLSLVGIIYLTHNFLCFYSQTFGRKIKTCIKITEIFSILQVKKKIKIRTNNETYTFSKFINLTSSFELLTSIWKKVSNSMTKKKEMLLAIWINLQM